MLSLFTQHLAACSEVRSLLERIPQIHIHVSTIADAVEILRYSLLFGDGLERHGIISEVTESMNYIMQLYAVINVGPVMLELIYI